MHHEPSHNRPSQGLATDVACPEQASPCIAGLPAHLASWLQREHPRLAEALTEAQRAPYSAFGNEVTVCIEGLPGATRRFLWQALKQHQPALASLLHDPVLRQTRAVFDARLHLFVTDVLAAVLAATRPNAPAHSASSLHEPPRPP
jgi:hypothetical protein